MERPSHDQVVHLHLHIEGLQMVLDALLSLHEIKSLSESLRSATGPLVEAIAKNTPHPKG